MSSENEIEFDSWSLRVIAAYMPPIRRGKNAMPLPLAAFPESGRDSNCWKSSVAPTATRSSSSPTGRHNLEVTGGVAKMFELFLKDCMETHHGRHGAVLQDLRLGRQHGKVRRRQPFDEL